MGRRHRFHRKVRASLLPQQARAGSCNPGTEAMLDSNDSDQESSAAQYHENNVCPDCGDPMQGIPRRGPADATVRHCGCDISTRPVREHDKVFA